MEADLYILCRYPGENQASLAKKVLSRDTRPLLVDDVCESEKPMYLALEDTEFPELVKIVDDQLVFVHWWLGSDYGFDLIEEEIRSIASSGCELITGVVFIDGTATFRVVNSTSKVKFSEIDDFDQRPSGDSVANLVGYLVNEQLFESK